MLTHANADQINAIREMVLNLLKRRIPIKAATYGKITRHKNVLREVGRHRNSLKRGREHLLKQAERILEWVARLFQSMLCSMIERDKMGTPWKVWTLYQSVKESGDRYTAKKKIFMLARLNTAWRDSSSSYKRPTNALKIGKTKSTPYNENTTTYTQTT